MYFLIISLPLLGSFFSGIFGYKIGVYGATRITVFCITLTFIFSCIAFIEVALAGSPCYFEFFKWFDSDLISFSWGFLFDTLTVVMLVVVTSISMCVHLYSTEYMSNDPHIQRFMSYLSLFTFFMIILVTADNFFQMFLGWEGVGLCSYLLVNFWFGRLQANKAALKAVFVNRIGDIGLALGVFLIYYIFKTIDYATIFALAPFLQNYSLNFLGFNFNSISLICFFFFIAATGKSAQIGLHTWLPDAMEGPTPVSALIHAATMVTAGVFLVVRCSPLFEFAPAISLIVTISGAMTAFMAASIGLVQNDLKRVIAYSTCSQLGYMMIACGTSGYHVSMFHLTNHAFFKALLFLSAGSIIHSLADEQDMRKMGGLLNLLPFTYNMMLIGSLSLMGFPFLTGFYSKDLILEWTFAQYSVNGLFAFWLGSISAFFTAFYSLRVLSLTFFKKTSVPKQVLMHIHEAPIKMALPLIFLSFFSIFIGYILKDMFVGLGTDFWGNSIYIKTSNFLLFEAEFLQTNIKLFPVFLSLTGGFSAFILYNFFYKNLYLFKISKVGRFFYIFFNRKWFFDKIYNYILVHPILTWGYSNAYQNVDRGILEFFGPTGLFFNISSISKSYNAFYNFNILSINRIKALNKILYITLISIFLISCHIIYTYLFAYNQSFFDLFKNTYSSNFAEWNLYESLYPVNEQFVDYYRMYSWIVSCVWHKLAVLTIRYHDHEMWNSLLTEILIDNSPWNPVRHSIRPVGDALGLASYGTIWNLPLYPLLETESGEIIQNELFSWNFKKYFGIEYTSFEYCQERMCQPYDSFSKNFVSTTYSWGGDLLGPTSACLEDSLEQTKLREYFCKPDYPQNFYINVENAFNPEKSLLTCRTCKKCETIF